MSNERLSELHEIIREPLRQKILLQLGQGALTFDEVTKNLTLSAEEIGNQLKTMEQLTYAGEPIIERQPGMAYVLTEKGHFVLDSMLAYPELASAEYREKFGANSFL
jgi:predicted transcriptional regulator